MWHQVMHACFILEWLWYRCTFWLAASYSSWPVAKHCPCVAVIWLIICKMGARTFHGTTRQWIVCHVWQRILDLNFISGHRRIILLLISVEFDINVSKSWNKNFSMSNNIWGSHGGCTAMCDCVHWYNDKLL